MLTWLYGTGVPKSRKLPGGRATTLKPAWEPIVLARRPLDGTTIENIERWGVGALNIDPCRIDGRHPANVTLGHADDCTPDRCAAGCAAAHVDIAATVTRTAPAAHRASRVFYSAKASRTERDAGCEHLPSRDYDLFPSGTRRPRRTRSARNTHPTVKPLALMRWLVRLVSPPGGIVLDPFSGSGTTGCAAVLEDRRFLGIEIDPAYLRIAAARITHWSEHEEADTPSPFDQPQGRTS